MTIFLMVILIFTSITAISAMLYFYLAWRKSEERNLELKTEMEQRQSDEINHLIGQGEHNTNYLGEMYRVLYYRRKPRITSDMILLIEDLLSELKSLFQITPIEEFGNQVKYDPELHFALNMIDAGEPVTIVEPGWRRGDTLIRKPTVRKIHTKGRRAK